MFQMGSNHQPVFDIQFQSVPPFDEKMSSFLLKELREPRDGIHVCKRPKQDVSTCRVFRSLSGFQVTWFLQRHALGSTHLSWITVIRQVSKPSKMLKLFGKSSLAARWALDSWCYH